MYGSIFLLIFKHLALFQSYFIIFIDACHCVWKIVEDLMVLSFYKEDFFWRLVQFSSVTQSCLTLCNPMDCSTPGFPVHHQLPEIAQTHGHRVSDAIQESHPLPSPSLPAFNLFKHQGLFQWASSLHQVAKVLKFELQHWSFQWIVTIDFLQDWFPCSPRDLQESSPTPQFKSIDSLALSFLYSPAVRRVLWRGDYWANASILSRVGLTLGAEPCPKVMELPLNVWTLNQGWLFWGHN